METEIFKEIPAKRPVAPFVIFTAMVGVLLFAVFLRYTSDDFATQILVHLLTLGAFIIGIPAILISLIGVPLKRDNFDSPKTFIHKMFPWVSGAFILSIIFLFLIPLLQL